MVLAMLASAVTVFGGCWATGTRAPVGGAACIYANVNGPVCATSHTGDSKVGKSTAHSLLGIFVIGDASIRAAKKAAGITRISYIDYDTVFFLGLYAKSTTYVYGD